MSGTHFPVDGSFSDLYEMVRREIAPIRGIGPLTVYDIADRIGSIHCLTPEHVYLHARPLYTAHRLGIDDEIVPVNRFPKAFHRLQAYEIEDCLCVYSHQIVSVCRKLEISSRDRKYG